MFRENRKLWRQCGVTVVFDDPVHQSVNYRVLAKSDPSPAGGKVRCYQPPTVLCRYCMGTGYTLYVEDAPKVEFMYLVFIRMPGESYCRRLRSLLYLCYVFRALINSLVCWFFTLRQRFASRSHIPSSKAIPSRTIKCLVSRAWNWNRI